MKNRNNQSTGKTNTFVCNHCGESGYTKHQCHKIISYLEW